MFKASTKGSRRRLGSSTSGFGLRRAFAVGALLCSGVALQALAEEVDATESRAAETAIEEEVVVRGQRRSALRAEIRLAEEAVYARFNEINSRDEFDIVCKDEAPMNSQIKRRVCWPKFWREAYAQAGRDAYLWITEGYSSGSDLHLLQAQAKQPVFDEELRQLAAEDEELQRALRRFVGLKQALEGDEPVDTPLLRTAWSERTPENGPLPYDATRIVNVEIGHTPYVGVLKHGTFTIAHLHGKIHRLELECDGRKAPLRWKRGVEWRLPPNRSSCMIRIQARPGSSFALYEFE